MKKNLKQKSCGFVLAVGYASLASAFAQGLPESFDVMGVKMGMTVDQVRSVVKSENPKLTLLQEYNFKPQPGVPGGGVAQLKYCDRSSGTDCSDALTVSFGQTTKVAHYIYRYLKTNGTTSQSAMQSSVTAKYGVSHESSVNKGMTLGYWSFTDAGAKYPKKVPNPCGAGDSYGPSPVTTAGCGLAIMTTVYAVAGNESINDHFAISAVSHVLFLKDIEGVKAAKSKLDADAVKKANSGAAPKL